MNEPGFDYSELQSQPQSRPNSSKQTDDKSEKRKKALNIAVWSAAILAGVGLVGYGTATPAIHGISLGATALGTNIAAMALLMTMALSIAIALISAFVGSKAESNSKKDNIASVTFFICAALLLGTLFAYGVASPVLHNFTLGALSSTASAGAMFGILAGAIVLALGALTALGYKNGDLDEPIVPVLLFGAAGLGALAYAAATPVIHGFTLGSSLSSGASAGILAGSIVALLAIVAVAGLAIKRKKASGSFSIPGNWAAAGHELEGAAGNVLAPVLDYLPSKVGQPVADNHDGEPQPQPGAGLAESRPAVM